MKYIIPLMAAISLFAAESPRWTYIEAVDGNSIKTEWYYNESDEGVVLKGVSPKNEMTLVCSPDYTTKKVIYVTNKSDTAQQSECIRDGGQLKITWGQGNQQGETIHNIGNTAWIQEFGFGLRPFAQSNQTEYKFCIVNPKDFSINKMVAKKEGLATLRIDGKEYTTMKIKITLQGAKSMFWKAYAWFDKESFDLIQYQGNKGPNTPTSIITLSEAAKAS